MTSAVSGVIVDADGNRSKQQDIVLMLKSMPRLRFNSGHDLIFQEGVVATIEIKTQVTASLLAKIAKNICSVRKLKPTSLGGTQMGNIDWPWCRILHCVVSYEGSELKAIAQAISSLDENSKPDIYLDLTKGILLRNEGLLFEKTGESEYVVFNDPGEGLARLLLALSIVTTSYSVRDIVWKDYLSAAAN